MKALKVVKKVLIGIFAVAFFGIVITLTVFLLNFKYGVTKLGDKSLIIIRDAISSEKYKKGDLVIVESQKFEEIKVGDEIFAYKIAKDGTVSVDLGTVGAISKSTSASVDDAIAYENGNSYSMDYVIGKSTKVYNKIGTFLGVVESKWGFLFIILVPCFLVFIYQLYSLIVEIKYGNDEEPEKKD